MLSNFTHDQMNQAQEWCQGRNGYVRIPLWIFFAVIFFKQLSSSEYASILQPLNLGVHECGHLIFSWAGQFLSVLGGTFMEAAAPFAGIWNFYRQRDYFALTLCFGWLSTVLFDVARYVGDARAMQIPLVSPFGVDTVIHDWNYLLTNMGILAWDKSISSIILGFAVIAMLLCLWASGWILWRMIACQNKS
jgi:hypothetical protein